MGGGVVGYYCARVRHFWARPVWAKADVQRAMDAAYDVAGENWRESDEGQEAFAAVMAESVVWLPLWRERGAKRRPVDVAVWATVTAMVVLVACAMSGVDITPDAMFGKWEPVGGVVVLAMALASRGVTP